MIGDLQVKIGIVAVEMDNYEAEQFFLFRQNYLQFKKFLDRKVFDSTYTGRVTLDIKGGKIKGFDVTNKIHYDN